MAGSIVELIWLWREANTFKSTDDAQAQKNTDSWKPIAEKQLMMAIPKLIIALLIFFYYRLALLPSAHSIVDWFYYLLPILLPTSHASTFARISLYLWQRICTKTSSSFLQQRMVRSLEIDNTETTLESKIPSQKIKQRIKQVVSPNKHKKVYWHPWLQGCQMCSLSPLKLKIEQGNIK